MLHLQDLQQDITNLQTQAESTVSTLASAKEQLTHKAVDFETQEQRVQELEAKVKDLESILGTAGKSLEEARRGFQAQEQDYQDRLYALMEENKRAKSANEELEKKGKEFVSNRDSAVKAKVRGCCGLQIRRVSTVSPKDLITA